MLGALLMTAGGVGTFALTDSGPVAPGGNYLVANHDLRAGDPLTLADVRFGHFLPGHVSSLILSVTS